jgi:tRNA dimethylallyltransferase
MWLAARHDITIISADSRQVYRGFDIGTGKPAVAEQHAVPHRGIDVADPRDRYSAAKWNAMALAAIAEAHALGRQPVVVGGTGFYISTLFQPLWDEPDLDPAARTAVQSSLAAVPTEELRRWCRELDPGRAHLGRAQLLRAVEIALLTGQRLSELHKSGSSQARYRACYLVVDPGPDLAQAIAVRASAMLNSGWVDEVKRLMQSVPADAPAWNASGYRTVKQVAEGTLDQPTAIEKIIIETRQFAKRQRTWFRNQLSDAHVTRLAPNAPGWKEAVEQWFELVNQAPRTRHQAPQS